MQQVDPSLLISETSQKQVKDRAGLQHFMSHCCRKRHYFFEIKKCGDQQCSTCGPTTLSAEKFEEVRHFPDPVVREDDKDHFKAFEDVWGTHTTEADRPSSKTRARPGAFSSNVSGVSCRSETVRAVIHCTDCDKPRCIFSVKKLSAEQVVALHQAKEDSLYVCGAPLLPPNHEQADKLVTRSDMECGCVIEPSYFTARGNYPKVCYVCGEKSPEAIPADVAAGYQSVHPICAACKAAGRMLRTRGERKGKKRQHE